MLKLRRPDRWTWLEVLLYCARQRNATVTEGVTDVIRNATPAFLNRCFEVELLDLKDDGSGDYIVHDWEQYNPKDPTAADRMKRLRQRQKEDHDRNEPRNGERNENRNVTVPRAQARARVPSPTPSPKGLDVKAVSSRTPTPTPNGLPYEKELVTIKLLDEIGSDQDFDTADVVRALAARLSQSSLIKVHESLLANHPDNRAAYTVGALQSELEEHTP